MTMARVRVVCSVCWERHESVECQVVRPILVTSLSIFDRMLRCGYDASDRRRRSPELKLVGSARRSSPRPKPSGRGPLYEWGTWPDARS